MGGVWGGGWKEVNAGHTEGRLSRTCLAVFAVTDDDGGDSSQLKMVDFCVCLIIHHLTCTYAHVHTLGIGDGGVGGRVGGVACRHVRPRLMTHVLQMSPQQTSFCGSLIEVASSLSGAAVIAHKKKQKKSNEHEMLYLGQQQGRLNLYLFL